MPRLPLVAATILSLSSRAFYGPLQAMKGNAILDGAAGILVLELEPDSAGQILLKA